MFTWQPSDNPYCQALLYDLFLFFNTQATSGVAERLPYMEWLCFQSPFSLWLVLWQPHIYQRDNWQLHTLLVVKFISKEYLFSMRACLNLPLLFILDWRLFPFALWITQLVIFFWMPRAFVFITRSVKNQMFTQQLFLS